MTDHDQSFHLVTEVRCSSAGEGTGAGAGPLLEVRQGESCVLRLGIRVAGGTGEWGRWDRLQNYGRYPDADGVTRVLECEVKTRPPAELIEMLREQHRRSGAGDTFAADPDMTQGRMRVGVPLALLGRGALRVTVQVTPGRIALLVDGVIVDEQWPTGLDLSDRALQLRILSEHVTQAAVSPGVPPGPASPDFGPPISQYWAPAGHNCWAGDAMLSSDGERLHLHWLFDRRMGSSKWGCGAHQFAHASTADLRNWMHHPLAFPVTEPWEATIGTGCAVYHDGVHRAFGNIITERLGRVAQQHPSGVYLATSRDGRHYTKRGFLGITGEPGIVRDEEGVFHAVASSRHPDGVWRTARLTSRDLVHWEMADANFLPPPSWPPSRSVFSSECFCWFQFGPWWYILGGRTGMWKSRSLSGPYQRCVQDVYDGLMVPQATVFQGRAILAGWLWADRKEFAGHLVFRELLQRPDGDLDMRRLPELEPVVTTTQRLPDLHAGQSAALPEGKSRLRMTLRPGSPAGPYGLCIAGAELRFDPARKLVQWGTATGQSPAPDAVDMPYTGGDFAILGVEGLERATPLVLICWPDPKSGTIILDAEIAGRRTMVTRRPATAGLCLSLFAHGGTLHAMAVEVSTLAGHA